METNKSSKMTRKHELLQQIRSIEESLNPLRRELEYIIEKETTNIVRRIDGCYGLTDKFELSDLVFAAFSKCKCGHGLAYPTNLGIHGGWHCSAILLGNASFTDSHVSAMPFSMYEVKSEDQPSANGHTTRPKIKEEIK